LHGANGAKLAQPLGLVAHLSGDRGGCSANGGAGGGPAGSGLPAARVGGEVVLGRLGNAVHPFGESGQGGPHQKNELHGDVWLVGGEWRWRAASGVLVGSSRCGEVVLGFTVLGVWSNRLKRG
jgi:hypothetical protein